MYKKYFKRLFDIMLSLTGIVILSPLILLTAVLVKIKLGKPIIFSQARIGKDEKVFKMYKFRSMTNKTDENGILLTDVERLTSLGKMLRSSSIDELPALFNILKGEMSIVGPRPLPIIYQPFFYDNERKRHTVRGGLSGLAQVRGRNSLNWEDRFDYDIQYINNITFLNDMQIIFKTIVKVIKHTDIGTRGIDIPEDFNTYRMKQIDADGRELNP